MDDDTQTTASLIERAILKNMDSLCYNLKKLKKQGRDFELYQAQRREEAIEVSSKQSSELEVQRPGAASPNLSEDAPRRHLRKKQRTQSLGLLSAEKKSTRDSTRARSLPRAARITSNRISNLT